MFESAFREIPETDAIGSEAPSSSGNSSLPSDAESVAGGAPPYASSLSSFLCNTFYQI